MDWAAFGAFVDRYGVATVVLIFSGWLIYKEIWPLAKSSIVRVVDALIKFFDNLTSQINAMTDAWKTTAGKLEEISKKQDESVKNNLELANHLLAEIRKGNNEHRK